MGVNQIINWIHEAYDHGHRLRKETATPGGRIINSTGHRIVGSINHGIGDHGHYCDGRQEYPD